MCTEMRMNVDTDTFTYSGVLISQISNRNKNIGLRNSKVRKYCHDNWMNADNFRKSLSKQAVFLKHFIETKTSPRFSLFLSEHTNVV